MRMLWRIFVSFFACTLLALAVTAWYATTLCAVSIKKKLRQI